MNIFWCKKCKNTDKKHKMKAPFTPFPNFTYPSLKVTTIKYLLILYFTFTDVVTHTHTMPKYIG